MSPFVSGALGAVTVLIVAGLVRRARWRRHLHRGPRGPWFLRRLFRRLGTRPEQERVLSAEAESLASELRAFRQDAWSLRTEVADLLSGTALDASAVAGALDARLVKLQALKTRAAEALARIHAALEPAQRAKLAVLMRGGHHHCFHGPHPHGA